MIIVRVKEKNPPNNYGKTPLHWSAAEGHLDICKLIIEDANNKNPSDQSRHTPLFYAKGRGHFEVVKLIEDENTINVQQ